MTEQEAAIQQVRETLIKSGIDIALRLRELRSEGKNFPIAVAVGGGLAIIATKASKDNPSVYRFGGVHSKQVASVTQSTIDRWNAKAPNHLVQMWMIQPALERECSRIFLLLHELEKNMERRGL